jgi:hypothetical protein
MTFLQGFFLVLFYMKYSGAMDIHGAAIISVLILDLLWALLAYTLRSQAQAKLLAKYMGRRNHDR